MKYGGVFRVVACNAGGGSVLATGQTHGPSISTGAITPNKPFILLYPQTGTTDDLDTINATTLTGDGQLIFVKVDAGDTITFKHGTGNIEMTSDADVVATGGTVIPFIYDKTDTTWREVGNAAGSGGANASLELSGAVVSGNTYYGYAAQEIEISNWYLLSSDWTSGSITIDIWVNATVQPTNTDSITNGNEPSITTDTDNTGTTGSWSSTTIAAGSFYAINIDSLTTITEIHFSTS
jgi:hypothetical protein